MSQAEGAPSHGHRMRTTLLTIVLLCIVAFASFSVGMWYSGDSAYGRGVTEDNTNYAWTHPIPPTAQGFYLPPGKLIAFDAVIPEDGNYTIVAQGGFVVLSLNDSDTAELTILPWLEGGWVGKPLYNSTYARSGSFDVSFNLTVNHCTYASENHCLDGLEIEVWANPSNNGDVMVAFPNGLVFEAQRCTASYSWLQGAQTVCESV